MKKIIFIVILVILSNFVYAETRINEIMYDPEGNDNNKEFIEIYSDEDINLSDYTIKDLDSEDSLELLRYYDSNYYLIVEENFNFSNLNVSIYSVGATIGNNLNKEDSVFLYYNDELIDSASYIDDCSSSYSLEYFEGDFYCSFDEGGSPGKENSYIGRDLSDIKINEFFPDPQGDDNAMMPYGEFIEIYNGGNGEVDLAGAYFKDSGNHKLYVTDTTTIDGTKIEANSYLAVYMNDFSGFLNNIDFEEIMFYDRDGNLIEKVSYAESKEGLSWSLINGIWQYRIPTPNEINDEDEANSESYFKIEKLEDVRDNEAEFGDIIKAKFHVYKGDTGKSSIKIYIENDEDKITKITKATLPMKFTNYSMTVPLFIYPNCNEKYDDEDYHVKIGWTSESEAKDEFKIRVEGINMDNCGKIYVEKEPRKGTLDYNLVECPGTAEIGEDFCVTVELSNNDGNDHLVDLYSYVYRGSKSVSGERDLNKKRVLVKAGETREFELDNVVSGAEPGDYKLKIKIKRDDQKTEKAITQDIKLLAGKETKEDEEKINLKGIVQENEIKGDSQNSINYVLLAEKNYKTVYESNDFLIKNKIPFFIIICLALFCTILIFKKFE